MKSSHAIARSSHVTDEVFKAWSYIITAELTKVADDTIQLH